MCGSSGAGTGRVLAAASFNRSSDGFNRAMFRFHQEREEDRDEVEGLFDLAFAPGRTALSSYLLREGVEPVAALCTVARDDFDALAGAVRVWPVRIGKPGHPALLLGPIAVHPTRQGEGLGAALMHETLSRAAELGWERVILVGDEPYYRRFGFRHDLAAGLTFPGPVNPDRFLVCTLHPEAMNGVSGAVQPWFTRP